MSGGGNTYTRIMSCCLQCKNEVSSNNLNKHYQSKLCLRGFKATISHVTIVSPQDLCCKFCNKKCKSENAYRQHLIRCSKNPDKIECSKGIGNRTKGKSGWNKGLTKETDDRIKEHAKKTKIIMQALADSGFRTKAQLPEYWTEEKRKEKSDWRKQLHKDFPEKHLNRRLAGNRNKMTYPEKVAFDWLVENKVEFEHQKCIVGYYVDFCIANTIIEIDGERWHPPGNEKDAKRDAELTSNGYKVYRIKSKERIENRLKEILSL